MKLAKQLGIATAGITLCFTAISAKPAEAAFVGAYEPANWTLVNTEADGLVNISDSPEQIQLFSANNGSGEPGTTDYLVKAVTAGAVNFTWNYSTDDDYALYDRFSFVNNGDITDIFSDIVRTGQGTYTTTVAGGDVFGLRLDTRDNIGGRGNVTISNFNAPVPVPEPSTFGGLLLACGFGLWIKRKQAVSQKAS
ncbi:PEP-CTERM sorting domain-containing protein [Nostoc commune]|uniref:PEP-CTERM sorting domain-containing protein n=1 Tax=Nostoc commune TaxID=1178 RepID=UPI0018C81D32|nr:PEP-CTERM sorting domain-containing protein [Nostoc commune]MBG1264672.1 PEP-CTERM sorting domain-containing protein [Nostoc commune BAE]